MHSCRGVCSAGELQSISPIANPCHLGKCSEELAFSNWAQSTIGFLRWALTGCRRRMTSTGSSDLNSLESLLATAWSVCLIGSITFVRFEGHCTFATLLDRCGQYRVLYEETTRGGARRARQLANKWFANEVAIVDEHWQTRAPAVAYIQGSQELVFTPEHETAGTDGRPRKCHSLLMKAFDASKTMETYFPLLKMVI